MEPANLTSLSPAERRDLEEWLNGRDVTITEYLRYLKEKKQYLTMLKLIRDNNEIINTNRS